ncbi:MAG TPA: hypothetical protein DD400_02030 [Rhodospirillaceae bacterium]|nr:hypothetical protein [Rhodospirillaceae bacterium]
MDFSAAAKEVVSYMGTPTGKVVVLTSTLVVGVGLGYCIDYTKRWVSKKYCKPTRKPFEGIQNQELPKSDFKP